MPLNADAILAKEIPETELILSDRDCMLYALSLGLCADPLDRRELPYVYEDALQIFPTMPVILGHPGSWMADPALGITRAKVVHGAQSLVTHAPLRIGIPIRARNRVVEVIDKGKDRGAIIVTERTLTEAASGRLLSEMTSLVFCRADGGFGGNANGTSASAPPVPARNPDAGCEWSVAPSSALLYRLNGDRNPLHADPDFARRAGFDRPILHGLCTYGMAAVALWRMRKEGITLKSISARFSQPVFPGENLRLECWDEPDGLRFRVRAAGRDAVVLDAGLARLEPGEAA